MSSPGPLVLVVEDEAQLRRFLRPSLAAHGYRVIVPEECVSDRAEGGRTGPTSSTSTRSTATSSRPKETLGYLESLPSDRATRRAAAAAAR